MAPISSPPDTEEVKLSAIQGSKTTNPESVCATSDRSQSKSKKSRHPQSSRLGPRQAAPEAQR